MIFDKKFWEWYIEQDDSMQLSMFNFVIFVLASCKLKTRFWIALEILLGKNFSIYISKNQQKINENLNKDNKNNYV